MCEIDCTMHRRSWLVPRSTLVSSGTPRCKLKLLWGRIIITSKTSQLNVIAIRLLSSFFSFQFYLQAWGRKVLHQQCIRLIFFDGSNWNQKDCVFSIDFGVSNFRKPWGWWYTYSWITAKDVIRSLLAYVAISQYTWGFSIRPSSFLTVGQMRKHGMICWRI